MASISLGTAALIGGLASAGGGIASSVIGSNAAKTATQQQVNQQNQGLQFQKDIFSQQQQNQQPYQSAGTTSIAKLMSDLQSGKFGAGSLGTAPTAPTAPPPVFDSTFTAPTAAEAAATPGYQFTQQQGNKGILQGAAAAGGSIGGGTLKALAGYDTNLANTTYGDTFNRAMQAYQAQLSKYGANLQGYQAGLQGYNSQLAGFEAGQGAQQQEFNQEFAPAQLGENAVASINNTGTQQSTSIAQLMGQIGQTQAAGTVAGSNAITGGIGQAANGLSSSLLLGQLLNNPGYLGTSGVGKANPINIPLDTNIALGPG